jgi:hypothetical protein
MVLAEGTGKQSILLFPLPQLHMPIETDDKNGLINLMFDVFKFHNELREKKNEVQSEESTVVVERSLNSSMDP